MNLEDVLKEKLSKQETEQKKETKSLVERSISRLDEKISTLKSLLKELEEINKEATSSLKNLKENRINLEGKIKEINQKIFGNESIASLLMQEGVSSVEDLLKSETYSETEEVKLISEAKEGYEHQKRDLKEEVLKRKEMKAKAREFISKEGLSESKKLTFNDLIEDIKQIIDKLEKERQKLYYETEEGEESFKKEISDYIDTLINSGYLDQRGINYHNYNDFYYNIFYKNLNTLNEFYYSELLKFSKHFFNFIFEKIKKYNLNEDKFISIAKQALNDYFRKKFRYLLDNIPNNPNNEILPKRFDSQDLYNKSIEDINSENFYIMIKLQKIKFFVKENNLSFYDIELFFEEIQPLKKIAEEFKYLISNSEYRILYDYKFNFCLRQFGNYGEKIRPSFDVNEEYKWKEPEDASWHSPGEISRIKEEINQIYLRGYREGNGLFGFKKRKREKQIQALESQLSNFLSDNEKIELFKKRIEVLHKCRKDFSEFCDRISDKKALNLFLDFYKSINYYGETFKEFVDRMSDLDNVYKFVLFRHYNRHIEDPVIDEKGKKINEFGNFLYNINFDSNNKKILEILFYGIKEELL